MEHHNRRLTRPHGCSLLQVFGGTVVANDLHIATAYRRSHGLNVITLDGDKADRKGTLTGGFHDVRRSRIEGVKQEATWRAKVEEESVRLSEVKATINKLEQDITKNLSQQQVNESQRKKALQGRESLQIELRYAGEEQTRLRGTVARLERALEEAETEATVLETRKASLEAELQTPMVQGLSDEESTQIEDLIREVDEVQKVLADQASNRSNVSVEPSCLAAGRNTLTRSFSLFQLTTRKNALEIELSESLIRRRDDLRMQIDTVGPAVASESLRVDDVDARRREAASLERTIEELKATVAGEFGLHVDRANELVPLTDALTNLANDKKKEELTAAILDASAQLEGIQAEQVEDGRGIARSQKVVERYISKRQTLTDRKDECTKLIRDLGILPEEAFEKYQGVETSRVSRLPVGWQAESKASLAYCRLSSSLNDSTRPRQCLPSTRTSTRRPFSCTKSTQPSGTAFMSGSTA